MVRDPGIISAVLTAPLFQIIVTSHSLGKNSQANDVVSILGLTASRFTLVGPNFLVSYSRVLDCFR